MFVIELVENNLVGPFLSLELAETYASSIGVSNPNILELSVPNTYSVPQLMQEAGEGLLLAFSILKTMNNPEDTKPDFFEFASVSNNLETIGRRCLGIHDSVLD